MKVLSWNILAEEWIDKADYKDIDEAILFDRDARFKNICKIINDINPDVLLLQEVMMLEYEKLVKLLGLTFHISEINPIWGAESGNISLFRKSMFTNDIRHVMYSFGTISYCNICSFINVHLDDESIHKRRNQMNEIKLLTPMRKCVIGGDFNHQYRKDGLFYKLKNFRIMNKTKQTYYIDRNVNIDNILLKGLTGVFIPLDYPDKMEVLGSDHLPILVECQ